MKSETLEKIALYLIKEGGADTCARCARQDYCLKNAEAAEAVDCLKGMAEYVEEQKNAATYDKTEFSKKFKETDGQKRPLAGKTA